jgi:monovalent cation:proton antiporter-2 (CPA2) family protein
MGERDFFYQAFVYLAAAVVSVPVARRLGLGSVLGYLIAGVAIGPFGLALVGTEGQDVMHFAEFGVVMMLFVIGLELQPSMLWQMRGALLGLGGLQVLATALVLGFAALAIGLTWQAAVAIGAILSLSSTAIVLQSLTEKGLLRTEAGERSFAVLLFQDIAVIPMLAVLPLLATGAPMAVAAASEHGGSLVAQLPAWARALVTIGAVAAIALAGQFLIRPLFRFIARSGVRELFTAAALLLVVAIALAMRSVGLSPALGTFLGGVVLANSEYRHQLESDVEPFKGLLLGLFFIAVGASIDFALAGAHAGAVTALVLGLVAAKFAVLFALSRATRMSPEQGLLFAFALAQGGEFCFVLFSFAAQNGVLDGTTANLLVATVALSMAATPFLLLANERLIQPRFGCPEAAAREPDVIPDDRSAVILAGFGAFGSVVGRFLRANGIRTTVLDVDTDQVDLMRRLGIEVYYGDASREDLLRSAGAASARLLIVSVGGLENTQRVIRTAKEHFPNLRVFARAKTRMEAYDVLEAGADGVYRASLDTSLRAGVDAMRALGFPAHQSLRAAQYFRRYDEREWRALADVRHDDSLFQTRARESVQHLERLLAAEFHGIERADESNWDSDALRSAHPRSEQP